MWFYVENFALIKVVLLLEEADNNLANCDDLNEVANVRIKPSSSLPSLNESPDVCYSECEV